MKKRKAISWILMFMIFLMAPAVTYFFWGNRENMEMVEKREAAPFPTMDIQNYTDFPSSFEAWYNDHIPYRNELIKFHNSVDFFAFGQSPNEKVVIGQEGWLFYNPENDQENPIKQSLGYGMFSQDDLGRMASNLQLTKNKLEKKGIKFILFIAPNKETIYKDKIPAAYHEKNDKTNIDQLISYLHENTDVCIVYPKEEILESKQNKKDIMFYYKLDTHWNEVGGYVGARYLAQELGIQMPALDDLVLTESSISEGDLTKMMNLSIEGGDIRYSVSGFGFDNTECIPKNDSDAEVYFRTPGADKRKIFVRRDSFGNAMKPGLAAQFENSFFVHRSYFSEDQIYDYGTDIFVLELVERNILELKDFCLN